MPDSERKSSDELIREAMGRLRGSEADQGLEATPGTVTDAREPEPAAFTHPPQARSETTTEEPGPGRIEPQTQRGAPSFGWLRWGLAALVFGAWFLFTNLDDANRNETGEIVGGGDLDVMTLRPGDCFDDPDDLEQVVFDVAAVPCSEPHDNEVYSVQTLAPGAFTEEFPGEEALQRHSYDACIGSVFDEYVGTSYLDSALDVFTLTPTAESWEQGDREFVCAVYRLDLAQITGTVRGSGL
jgi:hypothetical protein